MSAESQAARRTPPPAGTAIATSTTSTSAQDLSAHRNKIVCFWNDAALSTTNIIYVRFGPSTVGAAVATDFALQPGEKQEFLIAPDLEYVRAKASTNTPNLCYAVTG